MKKTILQLSIYFFLSLCGALIGLFIIAWQTPTSFLKTTFLSPLGLGPQVLSTKIPSNKPLIGFLPYWTLNDADIQYHLLDYVAYFSIPLKADGTVRKQTATGETDMGWYKLSSPKVQDIFQKAKKNDVGIMLTFTAFDNQVIDTLVANPQSKLQAIETITAIVKQYEASGVNIDFEYDLGQDNQPLYSQKYATFLSELRESLHKDNSKIIITADIYSNGFIKDYPYQVAALAEATDFLVLMGYDFHQTTSMESGPVAPLKNGDKVSISKALEAALEKGVKPGKIILAMPFYGYEWQTNSEEYGSSVYPGTGAMASYKRVHALIANEKLITQWDNQAMSPWIVYKDNNVIKQIHYENDESIAYKLQFIDQVNLGGGAIWALGYEGKNASIWKVIEDWRRKAQ